MKAAAMLFLLCPSFLAHAEAIYKSIDATGGVIYSDFPIPGAVVIERFDGAAGRKANQLGMTPAEQHLADAERALNEGRHPLPHEMNLLPGGGAQLSEAYFERVLALERAVERARLLLKRQMTRNSP
jgi:hypothetical protein